MAISLTESSSQHHPDALPIGTVLGDFAITGLIGEGGFGIVYLAYEATLDRTVAIKEYLPVTIAARTAELTVAVRSQGNRDAYTAGLQSFLREARMQARFSHPAMLEVYRVWEQHGTAYMAMRYYPGDTLRNLRKAATSSHVFDETAIQRVMMPVFDALGELHSQSVLHRDVSPDNILIMPTGQPVLLDFGAARNVVAGAAQSLTTVLKPGYAPIEQYADDGTMEQGPWTDVYGLGAVLYFLAMGTPPPQAVTRIMGDSLKAFEDSASALYSTTYIDAVKRALAVRPEGRLQSISELREALGWRWARTSESLPTTFIVPPVTASTSSSADSEQTVVTKPRANDSERTVVTAPRAITAKPTTQPPELSELPNTTVLVDDKTPQTMVTAPPQSRQRIAVFVAVGVVTLAVIASIFLFRSPARNNTTPSAATQPAAVAPPTALPNPPEPKPEPATQTLDSSPAPAPLSNARPVLSVKSETSSVPPAAERAPAKASVLPGAKPVMTQQHAEVPVRAVTMQPSAKLARPARLPIEPAEPSRSGEDADITAKPRVSGKTSSEVCERLLAKLSLGTDELSGHERKLLSACR